MIVQTKASVLLALMASGSGACPYLKAMHDGLCDLSVGQGESPKLAVNDRTTLHKFNEIQNDT